VPKKKRLVAGNKCPLQTRLNASWLVPLSALFPKLEKSFYLGNLVMENLTQDAKLFLKMKWDHP
jgi:hypothetical protein